MNSSHYAIAAQKIYTEDKIVEDGAVVIQDGLIVDILEKSNNPQINNIYDFRKMQLLPGLIDTHIHGANAYDVMQADFGSLDEISRYLVKNGITAFVPTLLTDKWDNIRKALKNVHTCRGKVKGAEILGSYVEGPYITAEHKGVHPEQLLRPIRVEEAAELVDVSGNSIITVAVAPEKQNALELIRYLVQREILVSMGHTNATYAEVQQAAAAGANVAVHTFNGMRGLHHREPGALGAILINDSIYAELIADFVHVHPAAIKMLIRCKPKDKIVLISDAMQAAGLKDGEYNLGQSKVIVKDSIARIANGSLAGSTTNLLKSVTNLIEKLSVNPIDAINMASINPAKMLGLDKQMGSIKIGKKANLAVVDNQFDVIMTVINGKIVYKKPKLVVTT